MKTGRFQILILRSLNKRDLQRSTHEKVLNHLLSIKDFKESEKRAEELIKIIEDERNTEADIVRLLEQNVNSQK